MKRAELIEEIVGEFFDQQFATCPTEEKEPFFWKWSDRGKEMITLFLKDALLRISDASMDAVEVDEDKEDTRRTAHDAFLEKRTLFTK